MKTVIISEGQNLVDICIQEYGSIQAYVKLITANGGDVSAEAVPGQTLKLDDTNIARKQIVELFRRNKFRTNSGFPVADNKIFDLTFDQTFQ